MKKIFTLLMAVACSLYVSAQTPLTTAVDFTATDCHGTQVHLFDILDGGQYVLLDFFYTTCGPCQNATPKVAEAYSILGCNQGDIFFMEVSPSDNDAALQQWATRYGIEYPTIGTSSNGSAICNSYGISAYPTVILIAPDRTILEQDIYPIGSASVITNLANGYGIQSQACETGIHEMEVPETGFVMYPNPVEDILTIAGNLQEVAIYNAVGQKVWAQQVNGEEVVVPTSQWENGVYFVRVNGSAAQKLVVAH